MKNKKKDEGANEESQGMKPHLRLFSRKSTRNLNSQARVSITSQGASRKVGDLNPYNFKFPDGPSAPRQLLVTESVYQTQKKSHH